MSTHNEPRTEQINRVTQSDYALEDLTYDTDNELMNEPKASGMNVSGNLVDLEALRCVGCKTVPFNLVLQCHNGHNICGGCYQIRVLDKMIGAELGTCPRCSVRIYRHMPYRNRGGEQFLADLIVACEECGEHVPRGQLVKHGREKCPHRRIACKYRRLGCRWTGVVGVEEAAHKNNCEFAAKQGNMLLEKLQLCHDRRVAKQRLLGKIIKLLQLPHITVRLLHVPPQLNGFPYDRFKSSSNFHAFGHSWCIQLKWQPPVASTDSPTSSNSTLHFRLCLQSATICRSIALTYTLLSGTFSDVRFQPNLCEKFEFKRDNVHGPLTLLYNNSLHNCERLLNERGIFARLLMSRI